MAVLMITYDTEMFGPEFAALHQWLGDRVNDHSITSRWIEKASELHTRLDAPFTSFIVGKLIELHNGEFKAMVEEVPQMDVQSHTYSHATLKTIVCEPSAEYLEVRPFTAGPGKDEVRGVSVVPGESLEVIRTELVRTRDLIRDVCGVDPIGISGPGGYYRGLSDRPDVLQVVWDTGNRISRCYSRNQDDFGPIPWDKQPFWYKAQGFPDVLEIPVQDWQDVFWRDLYGWKNISGYLDHLKRGVDIIVERDLAWAVGLHEWSVIENDPEMTVVEGLIKYAQDKGVELLSCKQYYERRLSDRIGANGGHS